MRHELDVFFSHAIMAQVKSLAGWTVAIFIVAMVTGCSGGSDSGDSRKGKSGGQWAALGEGMDWPVHALLVKPDGDLYAGGRFRQAGGVDVNMVAKWDGRAWSAAAGEETGGSGMEINALALFQDAVHACVSSRGRAHLSKLEGNKWTPLGDSINGHVFAMAPGRGKDGPVLFVAGNIQSVGQLPLGNVGWWDGQAWGAPQDGGLNNSVFALAAMEGDSGLLLYAGGDFKTAGRELASHIAQWDGEEWSAVGEGTDGPVRALVMFDDGSGPALYAGGEFDRAGGVSARRIARWDGQSWQEVGGGIDGTVHAMAISDNVLYVGGDFTSAGGVEAANLARWDGKSWAALGEGTDDEVRALAAQSGLVYAGGEFSQAGGKEANRIALWNTAR